MNKPLVKASHINFACPTCLENTFKLNVCQNTKSLVAHCINCAATYRHEELHDLLNSSLKKDV